MLDFVITAKLLIAVSSILAGLAFLRWPYIQQISKQRFDYSAVVLLLFCRAGLFVIVMVLMRCEATADVVVYYDEARRTLAGGVPFKVFFTAYSPLFPYMASVPLSLWDSPKAIMLVAIILEACALPLWLQFARGCFQERIVRNATVLYCVNPFSELTIPLMGQNHVWISFLLALSLTGAPQVGRRVRDFASGFAFSLSTVLVKWLALLYAPVLFMRSTYRKYWLIALILPIVGLYGLWATNFGASALVGNLKFHANMNSSGNLPYLLTIFGVNLSDGPTSAALAGLGLCLLGIVFLIPAIRLRHFSDLVTCCMLVAVTLTFLFASKKAFTYYLIMAFYPFCLVVASTRHKPLAYLPVLVFLGLAGIEPSLWFRWLHSANLNVITTTGFSAYRNQVLTFFCAEIALLIGYIVFVLESLNLALSHHKDITARPISSRSPDA